MKIIDQSIQLRAVRTFCAAKPVEPTPQRPRRLYAVFNVSRGRPLPPPSGKMPAGISVAVTSRDFAALFPNVLAFDVLPEAIDAKTEMIELAISARDEWVDLIRWVYELGERSSLVVDVEKKKNGAIESAARPEAFAAMDLLVNAEREHDALWEDLSKLGAEKFPKHRMFFADLDRRTEPSQREVFSAKDPTAKMPPLHDIECTRRAIERHVRQRSAASDGALPGPNDSVYRIYERNARSIAQLYLDLVRKYFDDGKGGIDFGAYADAYVKFANGELRHRLDKYGAITTQPSSGYYFYFAELALFCVGCGQAGASWDNSWWSKDAHLWRRFAMPAIWSQPVFRHVYGRKDKGKSEDNSFTDYAEAHFHESLDASKREGHVAQLRGKSFELLLAESIAQMKAGPPTPEAPDLGDLAVDTLSSETLGTETLIPFAPAPVAPGPFAA